MGDVVKRFLNWEMGGLGLVSGSAINSLCSLRQLSLLYCFEKLLLIDITSLDFHNLMEGINTTALN